MKKLLLCSAFMALGLMAQAQESAVPDLKSPDGRLVV